MVLLTVRARRSEPTGRGDPFAVREHHTAAGRPARGPGSSSSCRAPPTYRTYGALAHRLLSLLRRSVVPQRHTLPTYDEGDYSHPAMRDVCGVLAVPTAPGSLRRCRDHPSAAELCATSTPGRRGLDPGECPADRVVRRLLAQIHVTRQIPLCHARSSSRAHGRG